MNSTRMTQKSQFSFYGKSILLMTLLFFFVFSIKSYAQVNEKPQIEEFKKNTFHGGLGFLIIYATATMNYERIISQNPDKFFTASFVKIGFGAFAGWNESGQYLITQYGVMTGKKASHLELNVGPNFNLGGDLDFPLSFGLGYRHQKPGKSFMFRTGLAYPESLHFGMGLSF